LKFNENVQHNIPLLKLTVITKCSSGLSSKNNTVCAVGLRQLDGELNSDLLNMSASRETDLYCDSCCDVKKELPIDDEANLRQTDLTCDHNIKYESSDDEVSNTSCKENGFRRLVGLPKDALVDDETNQQTSEAVDESERDFIIPDDIRLRSLRSCRQKTRSQTKLLCPVCNKTLRSDTEVNDHIEIELQKLSKPRRYRRSELACENSELRKQLYQSFLRVKHNRQTRLSARGQGYGVSGIRRASSSGQPAVQLQGSVCPVCQLTISGTEQQLSRHVDRCLQYDVDSEEEIDIDDNGDDDYEEYEWAGQTRIRASAVLRHETSVSASSTTRVSEPPNEAAELNIEDDDTLCYGPKQFTEADLIKCSTDAVADNALRLALTGGESSRQNGLVVYSKWVPQAGHATSGEDEHCPSVKEHSKLKKPSSVIPCCLICMEPYVNALTSIQCWHVHCQECWLRALGVKKLCPQCNTITSPQDLRKLFL
jgi:hypothetical protein